MLTTRTRLSIISLETLDEIFYRCFIFSKNNHVLIGLLREAILNVDMITDAISDGTAAVG